MHAIKTPVYAHYFGETREIVNGHLVKDTTVNTTYDGKKIHVDLKTLMSRPTSKINLLERLNRAYPVKKDKKKTQKKTQKKKKTHKKKRHL
jgi:hypothetical protein